jgi:osmotically-inducible protein OsmY
MSTIRKAGLTTLAGAAGAAAAYMFDPDRGRSRRNQARDQLLARVRRTGRDLDRRARYAGGSATGAVKKAASAATPAKPAPNDVALVRKVESVIFRAEDAPKGRVSLNAEEGVVFLRGEVETQEQIDMLVSGAQRVDGVREVRNLMHLPGTPAPTAA